jgi:aspartyl-tRNA(Asn)/glutamyl-tRNA(Gln) amidotransferase subunit B
MSAFFDAAVALFPDDVKQVSNWLMGDFSRLLNEEGIEADASRVTPEHLASLLILLRKGTISSKIAKDVFTEIYHTGRDAEVIVREKGLTQIGDETEIVNMADAVIAANPDAAQKFRAGNEKVIGFLVGQLMKVSRGRANPELAQRIMRERLMEI